jgi:hypothetical protein
MFYKMLRRKEYSTSSFSFDCVKFLRGTLHSLHFGRLAGTLVLFWVAACLAGTCRAQGLELSGGYAHLTGDSGLDGFNVGVSWWFTHRVSIAADYDNVYDTSVIGQFASTSIGQIVSKSHLQEIILGPRIFFSSHEIHKHPLAPFAEAQFGESHLNSKIQQVATSVSTSGTDFAWMVGGGADYSFTPHWAARAKLDFLRTHFSDQGQSRLRFALEVVYTFGERD